jgi:hypothetical protein
MIRHISRFTVASATAVFLCMTGCAVEESISSDPSDTDNLADVDELSQSLQVGSVVSFKNVKAQNERLTRCIGVDGASMANGALVKLFDCVDSSLNQRWRIGGQGVQVTLTNVNGNTKCMGVSGGSMNDGADIGQFDCVTGAPNQTWTIAGKTTDPGAHMTNAKSGKCIGVDGGSTANGAQLKQFPCNATAPNQEWVVIVR